jgi:diaminopimelate decarboxylase
MHSEVEQEIRRLAEKNHSFFLYDLDRIRQQIGNLSRLPRNVEVFYAMKANSHPAILGLMTHSSSIRGIEIASAGEAQKVLALEPKLSRTIYTGPSKRSDELAFAMQHGIQLVNIESLTEAHRIQSLARTPQQILLRLNIDQEIHGAATRMSFANEPTPFGVHETEAPQVIDEISSLRNLQLQGLHIFAASGVLDAQSLLNHIDYSFELSRKIESRTGKRFTTLDFGGGIGIDYEGKGEFDILTFTKGLEVLIGKHKMHDKKLLFELGRYLVADSGYFVTTINDIKESRGKKILLCTAGTNAHRRPYALKVNYPITVLNRGENIIYPGQLSAENESVQVRGPLCTSADVLSCGTHVSSARIGDLVVMHKSGAYGADMSHKDFLSHEHVPEYTIGETK